MRRAASRPHRYRCDPPQRAVAVICDQPRAVVGDRHSDRPAPDLVIAEHEPGEEVFVVARRRAVALANATRYGLAAYVWTNDLRTAIRASERLEFGMVGVNEWTPQAVEAPFVGWKESGLGREAGSEGLDEYLETKLVAFGGL